jgi:hypothetical protein
VELPKWRIALKGSSPETGANYRQRTVRNSCEVKRCTPEPRSLGAGWSLGAGGVSHHRCQPQPRASRVRTPPAGPDHSRATARLCSQTNSETRPWLKGPRAACSGAGGTDCRILVRRQGCSYMGWGANMNLWPMWRGRALQNRNSPLKDRADA